jgi:hypothetical protein
MIHPDSSEHPRCSSRSPRAGIRFAAFTLQSIIGRRSIGCSAGERLSMRVITRWLERVCPLDSSRGRSSRWMAWRNDRGVVTPLASPQQQVASAHVESRIPDRGLLQRRPENPEGFDPFPHETLTKRHHDPD